MKSSLPPEFVTWIRGMSHCWRHMNARRIHRAALLRLELWRDGTKENAIPGYDSPPPDGPQGHPAGWSVSSIRRITASELATH